MVDEIKKKIIIEGDTSDLNKKINDTSGKIDKLDKSNTNVTQSTYKLNKAQKINTETVTKNGGAIAILDMATGGLATQFKNAFEATKLFNISLKGMKTALLATGIGALVVALGLIVAYWEDIKGWISGANVELNKQIERTQQLAIQQEYENDLLSASENTLKRRGVTQKEFNQLKIEANKLILKETLAELALEAQRLDTLKRIEEAGGSSLETFSRRYSQVFTGIYGFIDDMFSKIGFNLGLAKGQKSLTDKMFDSIFGTDEDIKESEDKMNELALKATQIQNEIDGLKNSNDDIDKGESDKIIAAKQAELEKINAVIKQSNDNNLKDKLASLQKIEDAENAYTQSLLYKKTQEENLVRDKYFVLIEAAKKYNQDMTILEEAQNAALKDINDRYQKEAEEKRIESYNVDIENEQLKFEDRLARIEDQNKLVELSTQLTEEEKTRIFEENEIRRTEIKKEQSDAQKLIDDLRFEEMMQLSKNTAGLLGSLSQMAGEHTAEGKSLAIASATIDMLASNVAIIRGFSELGPWGIAAGIAAVAANTANLMNTIKKIKAVKVPSSGGDGGGSAPSMGSVAAPQFNVVGKSSTNQLAETIGQKQNDPVKAYVVSGEVTTGQSLDRNRVDNSTFL